LSVWENLDQHVQNEGRLDQVPYVSYFVNLLSVGLPVQPLPLERLNLSLILLLHLLRNPVLQVHVNLRIAKRKKLYLLELLLVRRLKPGLVSLPQILASASKYYFAVKLSEVAELIYVFAFVNFIITIKN